MMFNMRNKHALNKKLTEKEVIEIKYLLKDGGKIKDIAEQFNVSYQAIRSIKVGDSWSYVRI